MTPDQRFEEIEKRVQQFSQMLAQQDFSANTLIAKLTRQFELLYAEFLVYKRHKFHEVEEEIIPISSGGGGTNFSLRYRNDTETENPEGIHRLEYINESSPYSDPDTETFWPDEDWIPVPGGDAVECSGGILL